MTENYVQLPSDTGNTGKLVRTNTRVVGGSTVHEHFMIIQDPGSNFQAQVISGPTLSVTGLAVYAVQAGSYLVYGNTVGGSEVWIKAGSIQTYNPIGVGSVTGQVTIGAGSLEIYQTDFAKLFATISGNIVIGSVTAHVDSIYVQSGNQVEVYSSGLTNISGIVNQGTSPWAISGTVRADILTNPVPISGIINIGIGSINIATSLPSIGSYTTQGVTFTGSLEVFSSTGSVNVYGALSTTAGSEVYIKAGSVQTYSPVGIGSVTIVNARYDLGSFLLIAGSISSMPTISVATGSEVYVKGGSIFLYSGATNFTNVTQTTIPWETSGITNWGIAVGSVRILSSNGSIGVYDADNGGISVEQTRGIFGWSGVSFIGSFTGSNIFTPGVGSKLFLKGFTATSDISTKFGLAFSGGTSVFIANYTLPASGTTSINYIGFEPSGATNQPIMVNLYNAGSLDISLAIKESL